MKLVHFLRDESGQLTVDWTVLVAAMMGVGLVVSAEVARGIDDVTDDYANVNAGQGIMTMFVNGERHTPAATSASASASASDECDAANPGNDSCVGYASETPTDVVDWGDGTVGTSDGDSTSWSRFFRW